MIDTAELIAEVKHESDRNDCGPEWAEGRSLLQRIATALEQQNTEFDKIMKRSEEMGRRMLALQRRADAAEARVRELEVELNDEREAHFMTKTCVSSDLAKLKRMEDDAAGAVRELMKAARDAIEAKTIERTVQAVRQCSSLDENGYVCTKANAIEAMRALNPAG